MSFRRGRQRGKSVLLTFTDDEWHTTYERFLRVKDQYGSFTHYARRLFIRGKIHQVTFSFDARELLQEIRRIGVNVNQIAWKVNADDHVMSHQISELKLQLDGLTRRVNELCDQFYSTVKKIS